MNNEETAKEFNLLLGSFLQTADVAEVDNALAFLIEKRIEPLVKKILRGKLHASLRIADDRQTNQDALEMSGEIKALILFKLRHLKAENNRIEIENFEAYVTTITLNTYHQYLRKKYPFRLSLKNQLRYLLTHRREFSLWKTDKNVWACGFSDWQERDVDFVKYEFSQELENALLKSLDRQVNYKKGSNIISVVTAVFNYFQKPVHFEDLISVVYDWQEIKEPTEVAETENFDAKLPELKTDIVFQLEQAAFLKHLWKEIVQLPLRHRTVVLLNLKDNHGEGLIMLLPLLRIASIRQIAEALEFSAEDFARIWNELPWDDLKIAEYLKLTRQQIINLRQSARGTLKRRLNDY